MAKTNRRKSKAKPAVKPTAGKRTTKRAQGQQKTAVKKTPPVKTQSRQKPVVKPAPKKETAKKQKTEKTLQEQTPKKRSRKRKSSGWAHTKVFPHAKHPARYRRKGAASDDIEYITFTHSDVVDLGDKKVRTVPMLDNISPEERRKNKEAGKAFGENRSYAYPKVFVGKRSALHKETDKFDPVDFDKQRIETMFEIFPREDVPVTGGKSKYKKEKKSRE